MRRTGISQHAPMSDGRKMPATMNLFYFEDIPFNISATRRIQAGP
jgi:hypothetical protein